MPEDSRHVVVVDFSRDPYISLHPFNVRNFTVEEVIRKCDAYPDGVLPGMARKGDNKQVCVVKNFRNFVEYIKIVEDETKIIQGKRYILSRYFDRRGVGWLSEDFIPKEGEIVGYYLDGTISHKDTWEYVSKVIFKKAYKDALGRNIVFASLVNHLKDGGAIQIVEDSLQSISDLVDFKKFFVDIVEEESQK